MANRMPMRWHGENCAKSERDNQTMRSQVGRRRRRMSSMWTIAVVVTVCFASRSALAGFPQCPKIGYSDGCAILIDIQPDGSLKVRTDPSVPPYDNIEDTLVGVVNHSG